MTALDPRLIAKGRSEPRAGLAQQGKVHIGLATHHASDLHDAGWSAADTAALHTNVVTLEGAAGTQAKAYDHASDTSTTESAAIDNAKSFIRRLRNALPRAVRESPGAGLTLESFHAGRTLGRSTPKIARYLTEIRPGVITLNPALASHFKGQNPSIELDAVKAALDHADTAQELARTHAPTETVALYAIMGQVLEQIEDLNRAGKSAFDDQPEIRAKFNKDILLRARKDRAKKPAQATPPTAPEPTPPIK
ncbi:MAG: hypothetical protein ABJE95_33770 [Byssovorax sp.]